MRENIDENNELDAGLNAASLSQIKVRRPKDTVASPRKVKSGDITDRLQALSEELEASKPEAGAPKPAFAQEAEETLSPAPKKAKAPAKPAKKQAKPKSATPAPAKEEILSTPEPVSAVPPRRAHWARPAATSGWQKKPATPDILSYWMEIRDGNRYPSWQNLDTAKIGKYWPNCTLVHCDRVAGRLQLENGFASEVRQATQAENPHQKYASDIEFTPMVVDWVLGLARDVANSGKPTHGTEQFPSTFDEIPLRVIALPLSENQIDIDHVLCYVQKLD
ncbi:hypothetical protein [Sneathiella sp.]|uniref:hypothetical protein n=1 Tax=Sneathiella sp. TaxID=1964365 RepID=UPI0026131085|nr:hypothetical protein [Sneathiella sp.]MDF2367327.1 hypothetical protein [Sneathiella sp.]